MNAVGMIVLGIFGSLAILVGLVMMTEPGLGGALFVIIGLLLFIMAGLLDISNALRQLRRPG